MSAQKQSDVEIEMLDARMCIGVATGNNAAWNCVCGYGKPLIGTTFPAKENAPNRKHVQCNGCGRKYKIYRGENPSGSAVSRVVETNE